jgi:hypothetical protein
MTTIAEAISRVKNTLKAVKEDAFLTDRTIYFSLLKYGKTLLKREDNQNRLMKMSSLFHILPYVELIDIDKIEADCVGIASGCTIKRTKNKLPTIFDGMFGPILRTVSSIDSSIKLFRTESSIYVSMTKTSTYKYNKKIYFWYLDGYLYIPNVDWDAIKIEAIFEGATGEFMCEPNDECTLRQEQQFALPEYLFSEIEQFVIKELSLTINIPTNGPDDNQNAIR